MESPAGRNGYGLHVVILADALRALFAEARVDALEIGKDERLTCTAADEGVQNYCLKERQTECIGGEGHALPGVGRYEVEGCEAQKALSFVREFGCGDLCIESHSSILSALTKLPRSSSRLFTSAFARF